MHDFDSRAGRPTRRSRTRDRTLAALAATAIVCSLVGCTGSAPDGPGASPAEAEPSGATGSEPPAAPLIVDAPDLAPAAGSVLRISTVTTQTYYLDDASGAFVGAWETAASDLSPAGAVVGDAVDETYLPGDPTADALIRFSQGNPVSGPMHVTGVVGDEQHVLNAWTQWTGAPPVRDVTFLVESVPAAERSSSGMDVPNEHLIRDAGLTAPTTEAEWVEHWEQDARRTGGADPRLAAFLTLQDSTDLARAAPATRVIVLDALTQVPGMTWTQDGTTAVFEATGLAPDLAGDPAQVERTVRVTVDLDRAVVTDYEEFAHVGDPGVLPPDVPALRIRTEIDSDAVMPEV